MYGIIDVVSAYILLIALLTLLVAVVLWQRQRTEKTIRVWLASGIVGILLGAVLLLVVFRLSGYGWARIPEVPEGLASDAGDEADEDSMEGMGGGMPGMGMGGGSRGPRPKRDLSTLVRKLELLTGDIAITLSPEQAASLGECLQDVEKAETMSDDDAKAKHDAILAMLDEGQQSRLDAISLPRRRPGGPGGPGPGGPGGPGGPEQAEDANPFQEEANAKALAGLRERLAPKDPSAGKPATKE